MKRLRPGLALLLLQAMSLFATGQSSATDSLLNIVRQDRHDVAEAKALIALAGIYSRTDLPRTMAYLYQTVELASASKFNLQLSAAYNQLVSYHQDLGRTDSASWYLDQLRQLSEGHPEFRSNYVQAAGLFYKRQQNFTVALPFEQEALDKARSAASADPSIPKRTAEAGADLNLGNTYAEMGDYHSAPRYHLAALDLFEQVGNKRGISFCYQMIGEDFLQLKQMPRALEYTKRSMALKTELDDARGIMTASKQLGTIFLESGKIDSAIDYYSRSLGIDQKMGLKVEEMNIDLDLGNAYKERNDLTNATLYFQNGWTLARQLNDTPRTTTFDAALI